MALYVSFRREVTLSITPSPQLKALWVLMPRRAYLTLVTASFHLSILDIDRLEGIGAIESGQRMVSRQSNDRIPGRVFKGDFKSLIFGSF